MLYGYTRTYSGRPTGVSVNASRSAAVLPYISAAQAAGTPVLTYHD